MPQQGRPYTRLRAHIAAIQSTAQGKQMSDWEVGVLNELDELGARSASDYFTLDIKPFGRDKREIIAAERLRLLGLDVNQQALLSDPNFEIRRPAERLKHGYGSIVMPFADYGTSEEDILRGLRYTSQNIQLREGMGGTLIRSGGSFATEDALRNAAKQLSDPTLLQGKRLVFDIESGGLEKRSGIWQVSARLYEGDREINAVNLLFDNPDMDMGLYKISGREMRFQDIVDSMLKNKDPLTRATFHDDFVQGISKFLDLADQADILVAQNAQFDIGMLEYAMNQADGDSVFKAKVSKFLTKAHSERTVDTRVLSRALFGAEGYDAATGSLRGVLGIASELKEIDKFTPFSMENILLETDLIDRTAARLKAQGVADPWGVIHRLLERGAHYGDVDTFFENQLFISARETIEAIRTGEGGPGLRVKRFAGDESLSTMEQANVTRNLLRDYVVRSGAMTPFTKMHELEGITPLENLIARTRNLEDFMPGHSDYRAMAFEGGLFRRWNASIINDLGTDLREGVRFVDSGYADIPGITTGTGTTVQQHAIRARLPFAQLSSFERMLTTAFQTAGMGGEDLFADIIGSAPIRLTDPEVMRKMIGEWNTRNIALPVDLLQHAEWWGEVTGRDLVSTNLRAALTGDVDALQSARWSVISPERGGRRLGLYVNPFGGDGVPQSQAAERMGRFSEYLSELAAAGDGAHLEQFGLTRGMVTEIQARLDDDALRYGFQIATLEGEPGRITALGRLLERLNIGTDFADRLVPHTFLYTRADGTLSTTATIIDTGGILGDEHADYLLRQVQETQNLGRYVAEEASKDRTLQNIVRMGRGGEESLKIYKAVEKMFEYASPKRIVAGVAGLAIGGYYLRRRGQKEHHQSTFDFQGYETEQDRQDPMRGAVPFPRAGSKAANPLHTAGTVQRLDREKTRHHQMGSQKYAHLY